jgi:hypothetical protein
MAETPPPCTWCGEPSVTEVVIRPGHRLKKTAPVCERHAADFESRGVMTVRVEVSNRLMSEEKRNEWVRKHRWMQ